ncbi:MAG TPA: hypothetical protein VHG09_07525 [Longimicrobiales bacterium]|nr:hypothetical protein [Longimicrobiales bacterium]
MLILEVVAMLALQQQPVLPPVDSVYETPALEALVGRAADANARPPAGLEGYRARIETELSFVRLEPDGRETLLQLEQLASDLYWRRDGGMLQEMLGYRSQTLGATFSGLSFFDVPWLVPTLYGERLDLVRTSGPVRSESGSLLHRRAMHPFAARRDEVYRFTGGDTVDIIHLPDRTLHIVRIRVKARGTPERPTLLFEGDIDLDAERLHIVRMQGRLIPSGRSRTFLDAIAQGMLFVQFETAEYDGAYWLPREERFEAQAVSRLSEGRVVFRVVSRFVDVWPNDPEALARAPDPEDYPYGLIRGSEDLGALSTFTDWQIGIGELSSSVNARDFDEYAPPSMVPTGEPRLTFSTRHFSHLFRINHVEPVFTGLGLTYDFGTIAPGMLLRLHGGYAWQEQVVRGGAEVLHRGDSWEVGARAERQLAHTNDFSGTFEPEPGVPPVIGAEQYDYVDRRLGSLIARTSGDNWLVMRFEAARASDRNVTRNVIPIDDPASAPEPINASRLNRPAFEGEFWLGRASIHRNPSAGGISLQPGLGMRLTWEGAVGDLEWQRVEAGASLRRMIGRFTLSGRADAGIVFSDSTPPQTMFELGTVADLPGFEHKEFTGDRAALGELGLMYTLPIFNAPIRMGSLWIPAPAPAPSVAIQVGWTDARDETLAIMQRFGWQTSDGARAALDLRMRFFGGSVSIGAARPLDQDGEWRFVWGLAGGI